MGRTQRLLALGACALALQPVAGLFSTTLSGAPTEAIQPGTPGAQTLEVRRCCAVSSELRVGACTRCGSNRTTRTPHIRAQHTRLTLRFLAPPQLQPWLTTVDPDVRARV